MAEKRVLERKGRDRRRGEGAGQGPRAGLAAGEHPQTLDFRRKNWILLAGGVLSILLGFVLLSTGEITLAPILLLAGYLVFIPWALVARSKSRSEGAPGEGHTP
jgi:hypothetical protein